MGQGQTQSDSSTVNVSVTRSVNLGDYENVKYTFGVSETVPIDPETGEPFKTSVHIKTLTQRLESLMAAKVAEYGKAQ